MSEDRVKELARLLSVCREYARHDEGCNYPFNQKYGCKCGWLEHGKEIDELLEKEGDGGK